MKDISHEELQAAVQQAHCISSTLKKLGLNVCGQMTNVIRVKIEELGIDTSHFDKYKQNRRKKRKQILKACPVCCVEFTTFVGPKEKTTCSNSCANKFFMGTGTQKRKDANKKISKALKNRHVIRSKKVFEKTCLWCNNVFNTRYEKQKCCNTSCSMKRINSSPEVREKQRQIQLRLIENSTHVGWKSRKGKNPSYPEKFFINVLSNANILFEREKPAGKFFIDFALPGKVALEIDGKQHLNLERKLTDEKKDEFLKSIGWKVYRISWKNPINETNKKYIKNEIEKLLIFLGVG